MYKDPQLTFSHTAWTKTVYSVILSTGKTLPNKSWNLSKQSNVLPVFNTEQTVLVQSIYVKQVSWGSLYLSATLIDKLVYKAIWRNSVQNMFCNCWYPFLQNLTIVVVLFLATGYYTFSIDAWDYMIFVKNKVKTRVFSSSSISAS